MKKKKVMKRIISLFVVMLLVACQFSFLLNVKAIEIATGDTVGTVDSNSKIVTNEGTLTVNNVMGNDQFAAYKILDTFYNATSGEVKYEFTQNFKAFMTQSASYSSYDVEQYSALEDNPSAFNNLASEYAKYIKAQGVAASYNLTTADGKASSSGVAVGAYLVLPISAVHVYGVMAGNVELVGNGTSWTLQNAEIEAKAVNIGEPFPSTGEEGDDPDTSGSIKAILVNDNTTRQSYSYNIGQEFTYAINAGYPTYPSNASNKTFVITEVLDEGITFGGVNTIQVYEISGDSNTSFNNVNGQIYRGDSLVASATYDADTGKVVINFTGEVQSNNLKITYKAQLNENAKIGGANSSKTTFTYSVDPYAPADSANAVVTTLPSVASVYTYGVTINNKSADGTSLVGATFRLYDALTGGNAVLDEFTIGEDGIGSIKGIAQGTYYLQQVSAPSGYSRLGTRIKVEVKPDADNYSNGYVLVEALNQKMGLLPSTGGIGTVIYTFIGLLIVGIGAIAIVNYRRQNTASK